MLCPICIEQGRTSLIRTEPFIPAPPQSMEYWDDGEKLHVHDSSHRQRRFNCTNGHAMLVLQYDTCPSCDYNEGRSELFAENPENNTVVKYKFTKDKKWKRVVTFDAG